MRLDLSEARVQVSGDKEISEMSLHRLTIIS